LTAKFHSCYSKAVVLNLGSIRRSRFRGSTKVIWDMTVSLNINCSLISFQ